MTVKTSTCQQSAPKRFHLQEYSHLRSLQRTETELLLANYLFQFTQAFPIQPTGFLINQVHFLVLGSLWPIISELH